MAMRRSLPLFLALVAAFVLIVVFRGDDPVHEVAYLEPEVGADPEPEPEPLDAPEVVAREEVPVPTVEGAEKTSAEERENGADEEGFPDPIQTGECTLALELIDFETRAHVAGTVHLWRLDAPGNEHWNAGDQLQASLEVPDDGLGIPDLPEGRYRVRSEQEADCVEDPEPFVVTGGWTRVVVEIHVPRSFPIYLRVYDQEGREVEEAEVYLMEVGCSCDDPLDPSWRQRRTRKGSPDDFKSRGSRTGIFRDPTWQTVRAGPNGLLLGEVPQDDRRKRIKWRGGLRVPGKQVIKLEPSGDLTAPGRYVSVLIDPAIVKDHLFMPDGSSARSLGTRLHIEPSVLSVDEALPSEPWRSVPIRVSLAGYYDWEPFEYTFTLLDLPLPDRYLVMKKDK